MVEIAICSDAHFSPERKLGDERWIELLKLKVGSLGKEEYLRIWDKQTQRNLQKFLERAKSMGHFDFIFNLGDATTGADQKGLVAQRAKEAQRKFNERIESLGIPIFSVWGNHCAGFPDLVHKGFGGMSEESFEAAEKLIGPAWFVKKIGKFIFLFLNSEIIRSSKEKDNDDQEFFVEKTEEQEKFIKECLENTNDKVIIVIHDPTQLRHLQRILKPHKKKIVLVLAGHFHTPVAWKIYCLFSKIVRIKPTPDTQLNVQVVPALWGKVPFSERPFGRGGFVTMKLNDEQFSLSYHKI